MRAWITTVRDYGTEYDNSERCEITPEYEDINDIFKFSRNILKECIEDNFSNSVRIDIYRNWDMRYNKPDPRYDIPDQTFFIYKDGIGYFGQILPFETDMNHIS